MGFGGYNYGVDGSIHQTSPVLREEKMPEPRVASKQMIEQLFDGAATSYNRTGPSIFTSFGTRLVELVPMAPGARALDVATGTGAALLPVARSVGPDGHVTGIDLSGAILQEAGRAARAEGLTNVELHKMDAEHLEFPDRTFDVVTCALGLFLFPDMEVALREMYRVCKPGGHIGVSVFSITPLPFDPGLPLLFQQFVAYQVGVQMPQQTAYAPDQVEALLGRPGFRSFETRTETSDIVYESAEDWWAFLLTVGPAATILGMDEETRARFKDEYLARLRPLFLQDGLHISVAVVYSIAQR
jgi:O-methyltransferase/aklanonic acid methyltransferase